MSNATFSPTNAAQPGSVPHLATMGYRDGTIRVYDLVECHVQLQAELQIRPEDQYHGRIKVCKIAFSSVSRDLAVLYKHAEIYCLAIFHRLRSESRGYFYSSHQQETIDLCESHGKEPVGLALASDGNSCVAWKDPDTIAPTKTDVWLIGRDKNLSKLIPEPIVCSFE